METLADLIKEEYNSKRKIKRFVKTAVKDYLDGKSDYYFLNSMKTVVKMKKNLKEEK